MWSSRLLYSELPHLAALALSCPGLGYLIAYQDDTKAKPKHSSHLLSTVAPDSGHFWEVEWTIGLSISHSCWIGFMVITKPNLGNSTHSL